MFLPSRGSGDPFHHPHTICPVGEHKKPGPTFRMHDHNILPTTIVSPLPQVTPSALFLDSPTSPHDSAELMREQGFIIKARVSGLRSKPSPRGDVIRVRKAA